MQSSSFWFDYFEENPLADDLADDIRHNGAISRFSRPDWHLLMTPVVYPNDVIKKQTYMLSQLFAMIEHLPKMAFDDQVRDFLVAVGFHDENVITLAERLSTYTGLIPCRWDILDNGTDWKVMEVNVGGAIGGFAYDGIQTLYDDALAQEKQDSPSVSVDEYWQSPYAHIAPKVEQEMAALDKPLLVVVDDALQFTESPLVANSASGALSARLNQEIVAIPHTKLGDIIESHDGSVLVFEVFTLSDIARASDNSYSPYLDGLESGKVHSVIHPLSEVFMSKAILALLREERVLSVLSNEQRDIINTLIPQTFIVSTDNLDQLLALNKNDWVIKDAIGYGGHGVFCGWECGSEEWTALLNKVAQAESPTAIIQHKIRGKREAAISMTPKGVFVESNEASVLGVFMLGDEFGGGCVRQSLSGKGVVCTANHAALGVMRVQK
ncbi:hypothetical protein HC752_18005 [Vibrio sp. S9_S30]|uniref:hypothetical protein n=1 Tax=Vibrio sp. S9_S30 TaxID=2720226 RepID=UPI001680A17F|nr:hypothetical protein [Vibrio sp. S9_S30]MBD1558830.1 hypothetical protein [Vibrio sp. S9_S30]